MNTVTTRPVQIYLAMEDGPIPKSIKKVLSTIVGDTGVAFVKEMSEADLVIFTNVRDVERGYDREKSYIFMRVAGDIPTLPEGCVVIQCTEIVVELIKVIGDISKKLWPITEVSDAKVVPVRLDALRILVIDDTQKHIASAKSGLAGHRLTTVTGYEDAMNILGSEKFDVVLTDLHLPMSSKTMGSKFKLGELVPYGILLIIEAARQGAKYVAVVTDLSHHDDPFSAAFDHYSQFPIKIENAKVMMLHARLVDDAKDWVAALDQLTKE